VRGKAGRVNASEPLMTPRNRQLREMGECRGDRAWPLEEGASGGRRDRTGRESTAGPRGKEGTQSGRDSDVRNVETLPGSRHVPGRPTVRRAEVPGGNRMPRKRMPVAERRQETAASWLAPPPAAGDNWPDTSRVAGPQGC
jgi:hypothetical protein